MGTSFVVTISRVGGKSSLFMPEEERGYLLRLRVFEQRC
jgi:hypothetical protein